MNDVTNSERADWARSALGKFSEVTGLVRSGDAENLELVIKDFLCDLMHLCEQTDIDLESLVADAEAVYREEVDNELYREDSADRE